LAQIGPQYWLPRSQRRQIVVTSWHHWQIKTRQSSDIDTMAAEKLDGAGGSCQHPHRFVAVSLGGMPFVCYDVGGSLSAALLLSRRGYDLIHDSSDFLTSTRNSGQRRLRDRG